MPPIVSKARFLSSRPYVARSLVFYGGLFLPVILGLALLLSLSGTSNGAALALEPQPLSSDASAGLTLDASRAERSASSLSGVTQLAPGEEASTCQGCHSNEYEAWTGSVHALAAQDPAFQEELARSHDDAACLRCHTTGFDTASGSYTAAGVTCEACHGPYKEGHPSGEIMPLPMDSDTCRVCHQATFKEWEASQHAAQNIECFDCHMAHTQGLRTGDQEKLCSACHPDRNTEFAHTTHGRNGLDCTTCHMAPAPKETGNPTGFQVMASNHDFSVITGTCRKCHQQTIHTDQKISMLSQTVSGVETGELQATAARLSELEQNADYLERRLASQRNVAVVGMGMTLGMGGVLGLMAGVVAMAFLQRRPKIDCDALVPPEDVLTAPPTGDRHGQE